MDDVTGKTVLTCVLSDDFSSVVRTDELVKYMSVVGLVFDKLLENAGLENCAIVVIVLSVNVPREYSNKDLNDVDGV